jgi:hypothetical protein
MSVEYKFNEDYNLNLMKVYVDNTYHSHYSKNKFQATEFIIDSGHGMGFCMGNIMKYAQRYGKKDGKNGDDLMKVIHYGLMALHIHQEEKMEKALGLSEQKI